MTTSMLVVDDEADIGALFLRHFRKELRSGEVRFHFAASGEEALAAIETKFEPALMLVLSDINMPGINGLELLRRTKQRHPDLPVVMITAYDDPERRRIAAELGAADFITKPIDFRALKARIPRLAGLGIR